MPQGLKTVGAIKEDAGELIESGKSKRADARENVNEGMAEIKKDGEELIAAGKSKVADAADAVKNAVEPPTPTLYEKTVEKLDDAFQCVKKATVG